MNRSHGLGLLAGFTTGVVAAIPAASAPVEFFVSPSGEDSARGTREQPFQTLARAQVAVREVKGQNRGGLPGPVTVWIREGVYSLKSPLRFTAEDSGTESCPITYRAVPGETPILSAGVEVRDWRKADRGLWTAPAPAGTAEGISGFHQLFARRPGQPWFERRYRPSRGLFVIAGLTDAPHRDPNGRINHRNPQREVFFHPGDIQRWGNLDDVELLFMHDWSSGRMHIADLDMREHIVRFTGFPHYRIGHWYPGGRNPYLVENVKEFLGTPGEWYVDRSTGNVTYKPLPDEDMTTSRFVAPRLEQLIVLVGSTEPGEYAEHLRFEGLTFAHTAWHLPPHLYAERYGRACRQGFVDMPAAVELKGARACRFERCVFTNLGSYAIDLGEGCHENVVQGNLMVDLGTGGVKVGTVDRAAAYPVVPTGNVIANNVVSDSGLVHYSGHGIWGGMCAKTRISHNVVTRTLYSSIAVGWSHSKEETACRENVIEHNHVHDVMLLLDHGGAIYTLGNQPGTVIRGNLVHDTHQTRLHGDIKRPDWTAGGLAFDDGSSSFVVEDNIIYDTAPPPGQPFAHKRASEMTVRNNHCGVRPGEPGFPTDLAARAGLEPEYRDLLDIQFHVVPPPILTMSLPKDLKPVPIIDTFDRLPVGGKSRRAYCRLEDKQPGKGTDSIEVIAEETAEGGRCLKVADAPGLSREWIPYVSYSPRYEAGTAVTSFSLRLEPGARLEVVWRGRHPSKEFSTGPRLTIADGGLAVGTERLLNLPEGEWIAFELRARLGAFDPGIDGAGAEQHGRWSLTVSILGRPPRTRRDLPHGDPEFQDLTGLMFISTATERTAFFLDSVRIRCE